MSGFFGIHFPSPRKGPHSFYPPPPPDSSQSYPSNVCLAHECVRHLWNVIVLSLGPCRSGSGVSTEDGVIQPLVMWSSCLSPYSDEIPDRSRSRGEGFDLAHSLRGQYVMAGKAGPQECEVGDHMTSIVGKQREMHAAHMTSIVRKQRKRCMLVLSSLSPFYSSWDPNSWNGAPPIHEEWIFPLQLT